jgi:hypothetical protein
VKNLFPIALLVAAGRLPRVSQGSLIRLDRQGHPRSFCPLQRTGVQAEITRFIAIPHPLVKPPRRRRTAIA